MRQVRRTAMRDFEEVTNKRIHEILSGVIGPLLAPLGFREQKSLHWLDSTGAPIRKILAFSKRKGGAIVPSWGLSLDFVPHAAGSHLKWHRTEKSARFDLTVDARDLRIEYIYGEGPILSNAAEVSAAAIREAGEFWTTVNSIQDLPGTFEWVKDCLSTGSLGFYNYTQHPIAYAFALALNGRLAEAKQELEKFVERSSLAESEQLRLWTLLESASAH